MLIGFILCLVIVVGFKVLFIAIIDKLKPKVQALPPKKQTKRKTLPKQKLKSIELNAEDIDRIYFRKSS